MCNMDNIEEVWKDIPGYEGYYQASDMGRVRSLDRVITSKPGYKMVYKGMPRKFKIDCGYYKVNLRKNGGIKTYSVHVLVAICFLNHTPCGFKKVVDHINNDKLDNRITNLQLITNRQNSSKDQSGRSSEYIGVFWVKGFERWKSSIKINGATKNLGYFYSEEEASNAYQAALKTHIENGGS